MCAAYHLEYLTDTGDAKLLLVVVFPIDRHEEERGVWSGGATQNLDSAETVKNHGIHVAVLDIFDSHLSQCYEVTIADERLHAPAMAAAPERGTFEAWRHYPIVWVRGLIVEYVWETTEEVHIVERH